MITRETALELLMEQNPEPHMLQHAFASEAVMRALAHNYSEDSNLWGLTGLLHDIDYPHTKDTPKQHGLMAESLLQGRMPLESLQAIKAHNSEHTGVAAKERLDFALRAAETVTGLITAAALVRPTGMQGMEAKSVKKKMKDKAFAASVSRERIKECEDMGMSLDSFLSLAITAMASLEL